MSEEPESFVAGDLQRPSNEGRSLHDLSSKFLRQYCDVEGPYDSKKHKLKRDRTISGFVMARLQNDKDTIKLLGDLRATSMKALWPGYSDPPPTKEALIWNAAQSPLLATESDHENGKKKSEDVTKELLPSGRDKWEKVALECYERNKNFERDGKQCESRFERLHNLAKPTGSSEVPLHVSRAKDIKQSIEADEVAGHAAANDKNDSDCASVEDMNDATKEGTNLFTKEKEPRRPPTRKRKATELAAAISDLGADQRKFATSLENGMGQIAKAISNVSDDTISKDQYEKLENDNAAIKKDVSEIKNGLGSILAILNGKK